MGLTLEATQRLFRGGHYVDIVTGCLDGSRALNGLTAEHRVLVAQALQHTGDSRTASDIATRENTHHAPAAIRSRCEVIIGMACRHTANLQQALSHYERAIQLAGEARDATQTAWAALHMFRMRAEVQRADELVTVLGDVRRYVARAGDPHVTAYMHDAVGLMEASAGRLQEARRHLAISRSLVTSHPNAWLEQVNLVASSYVDFYDGNYHGALRSLEEARRLSRIVGSSQKAAIDCNYGHALLVTGKFQAAGERFNEVIKSSVGLARLGALDGLARLHLVTGQLDQCAATLKQVDQLVAKDEQLSSALAGRWTAITRVKLLLRLGRWRDAINEASSWLDSTSHPHDLVLAAQLGSLQAEALAREGSQEDALHVLLSQHAVERSLIRGQQGSFFRAAAVILHLAGSHAGQEMIARVRRLWSDQGDLLSEAEISDMELGEAPALTPVDSATKLACAIANSFNFAHSPALLGRELTHAIETLGCSAQVKLVEHSSRTARSAFPAGTRSLFLGDSQGRTITLAAEAPQDPLKAVVLNDILTIGRAALELDRAREEERSRAALWPADPIDRNASALFIAEEMQELLATARRVSTTNVPVLITGETGTGKEVLARTIHAYSSRAKAAFLPFNCSSTPRDMLDSQLFGHRRGAFTGATEHFQGVIRSATTGTLFLDEIGDMGLDVQPKLLRFLESNEIHPVGEVAPVAVDVRVIAATNAPLDVLVSEGRFREDLFYRLNIVRLHLPPLRERRVEIPSLAVHYLAKHARECGKGELRLAEETIEYLVLYRWPGNVRQLANEMRRLAVLAEPGAVMMPEHLSAEIAASRRTIPASQRSLDPTEVVVRLDQPMAAGVQHLERAMMQYALHKCGGRMEETAAMLGLSRKGLYLKRQRFGILPPEPISTTEVA